MLSTYPCGLLAKQTIRVAAAAAFLAGLLPGVLHAQAAITWASPVTISGDSDVFTVGALNYAYDMNTATTVNGVPFAAAGSATNLGGAGDVTSSFPGSFGPYFGGGANTPWSALSSNYQNMLIGGAWDNGGSETVTLNNLTSSHQYVVQFWVDDSRNLNNGQNRAETVSGGANTVNLLYPANSAGALGQYTTGLFLANATSQPFTLVGNYSTQMNALQVRDVTNLGYWTGTDPNNPAILDTTSSNFATNLYTAPLATTTLGSAQTPLNGVTFADVYWNGGSSNPIAQNNITVAAGGVSTSNLYFQNNALSYTFSSADAIGISGSTAVTLSGGGMVTFNGPNSYTGPTAIYSGTLVLGNPAAVQNSTVTVGANNGLQFSSGLGTAVLGGLAGAGNFVLNDQASNPMTIVVGANNANTAYSGALSGGGSLSKTGTGTLTLSGASSYDGGTSINQGAIQVTNGSALGTGNIYIGSSGTLTYNTSGGQIVPVATTITGTGTLNVTGTNTLTFGQGGAAYQVNVNLSAGRRSISSPATSKPHPTATVSGITIRPRSTSRPGPRSASRNTRSSSTPSAGAVRYRRTTGAGITRVS